MEEFVENIKILINALGYKVLEPMIQNDSDSGNGNQMLYLNVGNASATAMVTTEGFVLGYSVSGPATWKDKSGRTLKEMEAE